MRMTIAITGLSLFLPAFGMASTLTTQSLDRQRPVLIQPVQDMWHYDLSRERQNPNFRRLGPERQREVLHLDREIHVAREQRHERRLHELWREREHILQRGEHRRY